MKNLCKIRKFCRSPILTWAYSMWPQVPPMMTEMISGQNRPANILLQSAAKPLIIAEWLSNESQW